MGESANDRPLSIVAGSDAAAVAARAWFDVAIRILITLVVVLVLTWPSLFPFLAQFALASGEVNILGSKFTIRQVGNQVSGLEIHGNKLLLNNQDISAFPDTIDKLTTANHELQQTNVTLAAQLKSANDLLTQVTQQRDKANSQLIALQQRVPNVEPIQPAALEHADQATHRSDAAAGHQPAAVARGGRDGRRAWAGVRRGVHLQHQP